MYLLACCSIAPAEEGYAWRDGKGLSGAAWGRRDHCTALDVTPQDASPLQVTINAKFCSPMIV